MTFSDSDLDDGGSQLGYAGSVAFKARRRHVGIFLLTSGLGISFLVFLNAAQAFVLVDVLSVPRERVGSIAGTLVFADELVALVLVLFWGRLADRTSPRLVVCAANLIVALALALFVEAKNVFPQLLLARMLFACGSAGITSMLPALLSVLSAPLPVQETGRSASESQPILGWKRGRPGKAAQEDRSHTRLAAFLGTATGCGALVAVFVFLRLPTVLAPSVHADTHGATGLERTFRLVAGLAVLNACVAFAGLPRQSGAVAFSSASGGRWYSLLLQDTKKLGRGFALAKGNRQVLLGYAAGFAARAQTITVAAFIPLYIAAFYRSHGLCGPSNGSEGDIKTGCHPAYAFASAVTGVINLLYLVVAALLSFSTSPRRVLCFSSVLGALAFALLGRDALPGLQGKLGGDDPRNAGTWLAAVGIGISAMCSTVCSLALVSRARAELLHPGSGSSDAIADTDSEESSSFASSEDLVHEAEDGIAVAGESGPAAVKEEIAGALAGAYSFCSGLGILAVSGIGGALADARPTAPFLLVGAINLAICVLATVHARGARR